MQRKTEPITLSAPGYEVLADVLNSAFHQAATGKGKVRHADEKPFHEQSMARITQRRGIGHPLGQADKKTEEAQGMLARGETDQAVQELLGAIIYLAGAIIYIEGPKPAPAAPPANDNTISGLSGCGLRGGCMSPVTCHRLARCEGVGRANG